MSRLRSQSNVAAIILVAAALGASGILLGGGPVIPLWIVAVSMMSLLFAHRFPLSMSIAASVIGFLVIELLLLRVSTLFSTGLPVVEVVVWLTIVVACAVASISRKENERPSVTFAQGSAIVASAAGSVLLLAVVGVSQRLATANAVAWAMRGDSVNVLVFSRKIAGDNGISLAASQQPTPLPFGLIASNLLGGRGSVPDGLLLAHDVDRYAQVWVLVIAATCLLTGLAVARPLVEKSAVTAAIAAGLTSLVPLSWFWLGIQFQSGFENTSLAVLVLLACWVVYLESDASPWAVLTMLAFAATALLAIWSPLVLAPVFLAAAVGVRTHRLMLASSRRQLILPGFSGAVLVGYGAAFTLPNYLQNADFLSRPGAFPAFALSTAVVVGGVAGLAALVAHSSGQRTVAVGIGALVLSLLVGTGFFMFQRRTQLSLWGYYPQKFSYSLTLVLIVAAVSTVAVVLANPTIRRRVMAAGLAGSSVLVFGLLGLTSNDDPRPHSYFPLWSMLRGTMFRTSEALATTVFASSGRDDGADMAWRYPDFYSDNLMNFWWLQTDLADPENQKDRLWAQREGPRTPIEVCMVVAGLNEHMTIHTTDPSAETELRRFCDHLDFTVVVDTSMTTLYTGP